MEHSSEVTINFHLNKYSNKADILAAIDTIAYPGGGTHTSSGLAEVRKQMFTEENGMRPLSAGAARVLIVLTDGASTRGFEPAAEAKLIHNLVRILYSLPRYVCISTANKLLIATIPILLGH